MKNRMLSLFGEFSRIQDRVVLIILHIVNTAIWAFFQISSCHNLIPSGEFCPYVPVVMLSLGCEVL